MVDHPLAALEDADPVPGAALPRGHLRRARQRPLGPPGGAAAYDEAEFAADALAVMDATATERAVIVGFSLGAQRGDAARGRASRARRPARLHRAGFPLAAGEPLPERAVHDFDERARHLRGLGEVQPPLLASRLPRLPRVLLRADASPSRTRPSRSRTASAGRSRPTPRRSRHAGGAGLCAASRSRELCRHVRCPVLVIHGDGTRSPARAAWRLAEQTGGELVTLEGSGHCPARRATRSRSTCCCATSSRRRRRRARWVRGNRGASARSTSPRRSGSATRAATSRSRTSCASSIPTSRSTGSPSIR